MSLAYTSGILFSPKMKKTTPEAYGIDQYDIAKAQAIKKWLIIFTIALTVLGLFLVHKKYIPASLELIFAPPVSFLILSYFLKRLLKVLLRKYRAVHAFRSALHKYEKWWIRTQQSFWLLGHPLS